MCERMIFAFLEITGLAVREDGVLGRVMWVRIEAERPIRKLMQR